MKMTKKQKLRLKELESAEHYKEGEYRELIELQFLDNKRTIHFRLSGNNKYYYACHCKIFADYIKENGIHRITPKEVQEKGVTFNRHSINIGGQFNYDIKTFDTIQELLGFVVGFNEAHAYVPIFLPSSP
jgi:hypothetical protein